MKTQELENKVFQKLNILSDYVTVLEDYQSKHPDNNMTQEVSILYLKMINCIANEKPTIPKLY